MNDLSFLGQNITPDFSFLNEFDGQKGLNLKEAFSELEKACARPDLGKVMVKVCQETTEKIEEIAISVGNAKPDIIVNRFIESMLKVEIICIKKGYQKEPLLKKALEDEPKSAKIEPPEINPEEQNSNGLKQEQKKDKPQTSLEDDKPKVDDNGKTPKDNEPRNLDFEVERSRLAEDLMPLIKRKVADFNVGRGTVEPLPKMCALLLAVAEKKFGKLCPENYQKILDYIKNFDIHDLKYRYDLRDLGGAKIDVTEDTSAYATINNGISKSYPSGTKPLLEAFYKRYGIVFPILEVEKFAEKAEKKKDIKDDYFITLTLLLKAKEDYLNQLVELFQSYERIVMNVMASKKLPAPLNAYAIGGMSPTALAEKLIKVCEKDSNLTRIYREKLLSKKLDTVAIATEIFKKQGDGNISSDECLINRSALVSALIRVHMERDIRFAIAHPIKYFSEKIKISSFTKALGGYSEQALFKQETIYKTGYDAAVNRVIDFCEDLEDKRIPIVGISLESEGDDNHRGGGRVTRPVKRLEVQIKQPDKCLKK